MFFSADNDKASGAFLSMVNLCLLLKTEYNFEPIIIIPCKGDGGELLEKSGIVYRYVKTFNWVFEKNQSVGILTWLKVVVKILFNMGQLFQLVSIAKVYRTQLVHINASDSYVGLLIGKILKVPVVWHIREFIVEDHEERFWSERLFRTFLGCADAVVFVSKAVHNKYKDSIYDPKSYIVYNGVDEKKFFYIRDKLFEKDKIVITIIGRICKNKGQVELLKALKLAERFVNKKMEIWIVGRGSEKDEKELRDSISALLLKSDIIYKGYMEDIFEVYRNTDIYTMCSKSEAFGRTTVEAMMSGCLVIGADSGCTPEIIDDGVEGFLYDKGNIESLSNTIRKAIEEVDKSKIIAKNGQIKAVTYYKKSDNAKKITEIYNILFDRRR